ncbi:MAG: glycerophosphodiester phosphodiesterase [Rickettsiales bacterium]
MTPLCIAHRGASGNFPENTMIAFHQAIALGANAIELDVHVCKSGEVVVIHDDTLERTTNLTGRVDAHSFVELSAASVPSLAEVLDTFATSTTIFIELKCETAAAPVASLVTHYAARGVPYAHMPVIGSHPDWLLTAKAMDANIIIGTTPPHDQPIEEGFCERAKQDGFASVNPCFNQLTSQLVQEAHVHGLAIYTWTLNEPSDIEQAKRLGVDGIITDYPERVHGEADTPIVA